MLSLSKYEGRAGGLAQGEGPLAKSSGEGLMLSLSKYEGRGRGAVTGPRE